MIKKLTAICLLLSQASFAQYKPKPASFNKFINQPKIEWAGYASDTFNFDKADLNNRLLNRLSKNEIKGSLPFEIGRDDVNKINYTSLDSIDKVFDFPHDDIPVYDSLGNFIAYKRITHKIDTSKFDLTEITQILYIENETLKSYIPFITPTIPVFMSTGAYLGERFYFTSCYNHKYNYKSNKKNKLLFLQQTLKEIRFDPVYQNDQLKALYGRNMIETLWPYVLENRFALFTIDSNKHIDPKDIEDYLSFGEPVIVPLYDSVSAATIYKYKVIEGSFSLQQFTNADLVQDWYYDETKNIVFNKIKEMVLYISKNNKDAGAKPVPVLKLVFN